VPFSRLRGGQGGRSLAAAAGSESVIARPIVTGDGLHVDQNIAAMFAPGWGSTPFDATNRARE
jgi:hypothetical protein